MKRSSVFVAYFEATELHVTANHEPTMETNIGVLFCQTEAVTESLGLYMTQAC